MSTYGVAYEALRARLAGLDLDGIVDQLRSLDLAHRIVQLGQRGQLVVTDLEVAEAPGPDQDSPLQHTMPSANLGSSQPNHPSTVLDPAAKSAPPVPAKIGRNDPCFCGSGKKFKKCHGA